MEQSCRDPVERYVSNAIIHGEATDVDCVNHANDEVLAALSEIRKCDDLGRSILTDLLSHENDSVRCWAATHLLKLDEQRARWVLQRLTKAKWPLGFTARIVLEEWRKGTLKTP